jgi:uncharacterized membrane protein YsdA (DUF1294 family)/cold shock CspA family protein
MRTTGKITHWNAEKGYGFITPSSGAKQVFVHIRAFSNQTSQPAINQLVTFALSTDKQGRPCAVRVVRVGEPSPERIKRNDGTLMMGGAVLFLVFVGVTAFAGEIPPIVLFIYLGASVLTYVVYFSDKSAARANGQRTPEKTLHVLSLLGGWPGAMIAQQTLRHKSSKESFRAVFWATVIANCCVCAWLFTSSGSSALMTLLR